MTDKHEISTEEKQTFVELLDRLEPKLLIDEPDIALLGFPELVSSQEDDEEEDSVTHFERANTFIVDGITVTVERSDTYDEENNLISQGNSVTTVQEFAIAGIKLVTEKTYMVDWYAAENDLKPNEDSDEECFEATYEQTDYEVGPDGVRAALVSEYEATIKQLQAQGETHKMRQTRREAVAAEMQEHGSEHEIEQRLTKARYADVSVLLQKIVS